MLPLDISSLRRVLSRRTIALIVVALGAILSSLLILSADTVFLYPLSSKFLSGAPSSQPTLDQIRQQVAELFERTKIGHLEQKSFNATWMTYNFGYHAPVTTLDPSISSYVDRLSPLVEKWFSGLPAEGLLLSAIENLGHHTPPPLLDKPMLKRVMTTDKNGRDGVPQLFSRWGERLSDWDVVIKDDAGMEEEFERLTQDDLKRDADPRAGQELGRMWALLPKGVLKADVLRYLVLLLEGGIYTDSDTVVRQHPYLWGTSNTRLLPPSLAAIESVASCCRPLFSLSSPYISAPTDHLEPGRGGITDPTVSMVLSIECDAAFDGELAQWNIDNPAKKCVRSLQVIQWTMMSKPFHPIFIDVVLSIFEGIEVAAAEGRLDGSVPTMELTGPGIFSDAVYRYLLAAYGITPLDMFDHNQTHTVYRIGDVIMLGRQGYSFPQWELDGNWNSEYLWWQPVAHFFRGSWKGDGWDG
ncbi:hypothetical protein JCM24511_10104 [Saitozyma sp. JCM 24511]|nr:hypothetical protein JCM24511_10104 [Saitozyma sp. JCM 24511]